jgi:hypothetical protein
MDPNKVDAVVDILLELRMDDINAIVGARKQMLRQQSLKTASNKIKDITPCELGEFWLLVLLQVCSHLCVHLESGQHLRNIMYPVPGRHPTTMY